MVEPALAARRMTVHRLTRGAFSPHVIRWAVPSGVSLGIVSGLLLVMYGIELAYLIYASSVVRNHRDRHALRKTPRRSLARSLASSTPRAASWRSGSGLYVAPDVSRA